MSIVGGQERDHTILLTLDLTDSDVLTECLVVIPLPSSSGPQPSYT
ncbi:MAG TPA: hypothetical protein VHW74_14650 [Mycobacteriales bacterium]|jgi:hypothetical protein|nr:hypothetical protein [Mycobacteriales bacterium]